MGVSSNFFIVSFVFLIQILKPRINQIVDVGSLLQVTSYRVHKLDANRNWSIIVELQPVSSLTYRRRTCAAREGTKSFVSEWTGLSVLSLGSAQVFDSQRMLHTATCSSSEVPQSATKRHKVPRPSPRAKNANNHMHNTSMQCEMIWKLILQKYNFLCPWSSFSQQDRWKTTHCYCKSTCYSAGGFLERCQNCLDRNSGWVCPKMLQVQKYTTEFTAKHCWEVQHKFKVLSRKFLNMFKIDLITAVLLTLSLQFF